MRSSCPYPRLDWDDTKYCNKCKSITSHINKTGCIICNKVNERLL